MEHRLVLAVLAKECDVLAEVHVLEMIRDKAAVATLNAFAEFFENVSFVCHMTGAASILLAIAAIAAFYKIRIWMPAKGASRMLAAPVT